MKFHFSCFIHEDWSIALYWLELAELFYVYWSENEMVFYLNTDIKIDMVHGAIFLSSCIVYIFKLNLQVQSGFLKTNLLTSFIDTWGRLQPQSKLSGSGIDVERGWNYFIFIKEFFRCWESHSNFINDKLSKNHTTWFQVFLCNWKFPSSINLSLSVLESWAIISLSWCEPVNLLFPNHFKIYAALRT